MGSNLLCSLCYCRTKTDPSHCQILLYLTKLGTTFYTLFYLSAVEADKQGHI